MQSEVNSGVSSLINLNGSYHLPSIRKRADRCSRNDAGKATLATEEAIRENRWEAMSLKQKVGDWSARNQYKIILGSWMLSMGVSGAIIMRDK